MGITRKKKSIDIPALALDSVGHSICAGGGAIFMSEHGYATKVAGALQVPKRRLGGIGGAVAAWAGSGTAGGATGDGGYPMVYKKFPRPLLQGEVVTPRHGVMIVHYGLNDAAAYGMKPLVFQEAMNSIFSWLKSGVVFEAGDATYFPLTGTWGILGPGWDTIAAGGTAYSTTTVNDYAEIKVPAWYDGRGRIAARFVLNSAHKITVGVKIDGVNQPDIVLDGTLQCDSENNKVGSITRKFGPLPAGAHTIRLTLKSVDAVGSQFYVDQWGIEAVEGPLFIVPKLHYPYDYTGWASPTWKHGYNAAAPVNDATVDAFNAALETALQDYAAQSILVDLSEALPKDLALFIDDKTHPNEVGHGRIADAILNAIEENQDKVEAVDFLASTPTLSPMWLEIGDPGSVPFSANWTNFASGFESVAFRKDEEGMVHLKGFAKSSVAANPNVIFTLPVGYRPKATTYFTCPSSGAVAPANVQVTSNGGVGVMTNNPAANGGLALDGIRFQAEA